MFKFCKGILRLQREFCILPSSDIASSRFCHWIKASLNSARCLNEELKYRKWDLPCGSVVENPPAHAGNTGLILVQEDPTGRGATKPVCHNYWATLSSRSCSKSTNLGPALRHKRPPRWEGCSPQSRAALPTTTGGAPACTAPNAQRGPSPKTQETAWGL